MIHFQTAIQNGEKYINNFLNIIVQNYNHYNQVINMVVCQKRKEIYPNIEEYSTYIINSSFNYYNKMNEYFSNNYDNIIVTLLLLIFVVLFIILDYQKYNKNILENRVMLDKEKLIKRIEELEQHSHELHKKNEKMTSMLKLYKSSKHTSDFGYFKLEGDQSSRSFRRMVKSMQGEYLGGNIFLIPTRYIGEFINLEHKSINDMN